MSEIELKELILREEESDFLKKYYIDQYSILRNTSQILFLDYNLIHTDKIYHIKFPNSNENNGKDTEKIEFITLPETYNTRKIHTHNIVIEINKNSMDLKESNDETIERLCNCYKIWIFGQAKTNISLIINDLNEDLKSTSKRSKLTREYRKFKEIYGKYSSTLINYLYEKFQSYLKPITKYNSESIYSNLCDGEKEINTYVNKLNKVASKKNYKLREKIARLTHWLECLIESPYEMLIAIDLPKDFYNSEGISSKYSMNQNHITITLHTEETLYGYVDFQKRFISRSLISGETREFILKILTPEDCSIYYEITPPENTRIAKVIRGINTSCCIIMMEESQRQKRVNFKDDFNERFILHIPRDESDKFEDFAPRFFIEFRPFKSLQYWILVSFLLGLGYLFFLIFLFVSHFFINPNSIEFEIISILVDLAKIQAPWIYGLIIGNQLWIQKPRFLWKNSTYFSIIIIISGICLLILCIILNTYLKCQV